MKRFGLDPLQITRCTDATFYGPQKKKWPPGMVFVCPWSDFFIEEADPWRDEAWEVMRQSPQHIFQILTKRPERIADCLPANWPLGLEHVWLGVTVESQKYVSRIRYLQGSGASVIFVSCEPLLEPVVLDPYLRPTLFRPLDWLICGAESGPGARPMQEAWVRALRNQAVDAGVPFFYKQQIVDGKKISMPMLDGKRWDQYPGETSYEG